MRLTGVGYGGWGRARAWRDLPIWIIASLGMSLLVSQLEEGAPVTGIDKDWGPGRHSKSDSWGGRDLLRGNWILGQRESRNGHREANNSWCKMVPDVHFHLPGKSTVVCVQEGS